MKMKVIDRILLALYALLGALALVAVGVNAVRPGWTGPWIERIGTLLQNNTWAKAVAWALLALLVVWSVRLILLAFSRGGEKHGDRSSVTVQNGGDGSVRVSVSAMDTLVRQAIGPAEGVVSLKTKVINHEDSITVRIDMALTSDAHIPNVTMLMQRNIKRFIEEYSGIAVREVVILVSEIRAIGDGAAPAGKLEGGRKKVLVAPEKVESREAPAAATPAPAAAEAPAESPAEARAESPAESRAEAPAEAPAKAPAEAPRFAEEPAPYEEPAAETPVDEPAADAEAPAPVEAEMTAEEPYAAPDADDDPPLTEDGWPALRPHVPELKLDYLDSEAEEERPKEAGQEDEPSRD